MNIKNGLICVLIIAILTSCVPTITAASTSRQTTAIHSGHSADSRALETTSLAMGFINNDGKRVNTTKVNENVTVFGLLFAGTTSAPNPIGNANINIQQMENGTWVTVFNTTTMTGQYAGIFGALVKPDSVGVYSFRAIYDGDSQYAPAVSNVANLTVS